MPRVQIGDLEYITADKDRINTRPTIEKDDLRLDRDETLGYKRRVYRRYDAEHPRDASEEKYKQLLHRTRKRGLDFPLTRQEFEDLLDRTPVETEDTLTCLSSLLERRDGSVSFHPYKGGILVKYLGRLVLDTSY